MPDYNLLPVNGGERTAILDGPVAEIVFVGTRHAELGAEVLALLNGPRPAEVVEACARIVEEKAGRPTLAALIRLDGLKLAANKSEEAVA